MNISKHQEEYVKEMRRRGYSENSIKNYASCLALFLSESVKEHPLHINETDIKEYLGKFTVPNTQRNIHSAIKKFYDICFGQKEKFKYIRYCKKSNKLPIVLSQEEMKRLFDACKNLKHKCIMSLMYGCGMRVGEVINLKPNHIDSSRMIINIIQGKGKKDRQVMLPLVLLEMLRKYWKEYKPVEYLFNGQFSIQYSQRSVNMFVKDYAEKAGIKNKRIYAHLFRHCSFTHLVESGVDINIIKRLAGHSSVKTTNTYCHTSHNYISKIQSPLTAIL